MKRVRSFGKKIFVLLIILLIGGILIQFIRPPLDNPPITGDLSAPPAVKAILQKACYDCHSNETRLAWFDQGAPAYWLVVRDVKAGRKVLNFSNWDSLPKAQQEGKLFESLNQIEYKTMPLKQYTLLHHGAVLSKEDGSVLKQYLSTLTYKAAPDTARQRIGWEQYAKWIQAAMAAPAGVTAGVPAEGVPDAPNGISYRNGSPFRNWTAISHSERYDNGTLRVIFGNDIAIKAVREGNTNPWPDGATFAKVAWDQSADSSGEIHAGAYKQVEFMIRDSKKYAATNGWGWARWVGGVALKPYGKDASFPIECMNCHRPMQDRDHVFTFPLGDTLALGPPATFIHEPLADHPLTGRVITSLVNPREGTMSLVYGNEVAIQAARKGVSYPAGSTVTLVTWWQREDPHWFGARIPGAIRSVEQLIYTPAPQPVYERYEGDPLLRQMPRDSITVRNRVRYIISQKASVMP